MTVIIKTRNAFSTHAHKSTKVQEKSWGVYFIVTKIEDKMQLQKQFLHWII